MLAFDFGLKRIGIALGERQMGIAHPLQTIAAESNRCRFDAIAALIQEWRPVLLVVGFPRHLDGAEHELAARCRRFAHQLEGRFRVSTVLVDERLSSAAAEESLGQAGVHGRKQKPVLDQVAAQHILQQFFDNDG